MQQMLRDDRKSLIYFNLLSVFVLYSYVLYILKCPVLYSVCSRDSLKGDGRAIIRAT